MREKTSLERSHSGWSNFKLTIFSLFTLISFTALWCSLVLIKINLTLAIFIGVPALVILILALVLVKGFVR